MPLVNLEDVNFLDPKDDVSVEVQVGSSTVSMYPVSLMHVLRFQKAFKQILPAVRDMFFRYQDESGQRQQSEKHLNGMTIDEIVLVPADAALSKQHRDFRTQSIQAAIEGLMSEDGMVQIAICILDSARDAFPRKNEPFNAADGKALIERTSLPVFLQLAVGLVKANLQSFPLGRKAAAKAVAKMEGEIDRFGQVGSEANSESKSEHPSDDSGA